MCQLKTNTWLAFSFIAHLNESASSSNYSNQYPEVSHFASFRMNGFCTSSSFIHYSTSTFKLRSFKKHKMQLCNKRIAENNSQCSFSFHNENKFETLILYTPRTLDVWTLALRNLGCWKVCTSRHWLIGT